MYHLTIIAKKNRNYRKLKLTFALSFCSQKHHEIMMMVQMKEILCFKHFSVVVVLVGKLNFFSWQKQIKSSDIIIINVIDR